MGTVAPALAASTRQDNPLESPRSRAHLRIAIDARKLHDYGIGTYVRNLLRELARQDDDAEYVLLCFPADVELLRALGPRFHPLVERSGNYSVREQFGIPLALTRARGFLPSPYRKRVAKRIPRRGRARRPTQTNPADPE